VPFADPDAWGYIGPAVTAPLDGHFIQIYGRGFLYPSFVRVALAATGSFTGLVTLQHIIGLIGALCFWMAWRESQKKLPPDSVLSILHTATGLVAIAAYTLSNKLMFYEHSLRPEAIFPAFAAFTLWLLVRCFTLDRPSPALGRTVAGLGVMHAVLFCLHPSFGFAAAGCLVPVWVKLGLSSASTWRKILAVAALPLGILGLHVLENAVYSKRDSTGRIFGSMTMFAFNADIVAMEIDADLSRPGTAAYPDEVLQNCSRLMHANFERTLREGRTHDSLPYRPDEMIYSRDSVVSYLREYWHDDPDKLNTFFHHYFFRGILHHPVIYAAKIGRGLNIPYGSSASLMAYVSPRIDVIHELNYTQESLVDAYPRLKEYPPGHAYASELAATPRTEQAENEEAVQLAVYGLRRFYSPLGAFCLAALAGAAVAAARTTARQTHWRGLRDHAALVATLFSYNFLLSLMFAMVSAMDNIRYTENQLVFTLFSFFSGVMLVLHAAFIVVKAAPAIPRSATATP
jgi:hypothetical protein